MFGKLLCSSLILAAGSAAAPAALVHQFKSSDYTAGGSSAVWTDSVGSNHLTNAGAASTRPILVTGATPTGQSAVQFDRTGGFGDGGRYLQFTNPLGAAFTSSPNFAIVAVIRHTNTTQFGQVISGNQNGDLQLRVNGSAGSASGLANVSRRNLADVGNSATPVGSDFIVLTFTYNGSNWAFYRDGVADGSGSFTGTFTSPELVGTGPGISTSFIGQIAELRLYSTAAIDVSGITNELRNTYIVPEPASLALIGAAALCLFPRRRNSTA